MKIGFGGDEELCRCREERGGGITMEREEAIKIISLFRDEWDRNSRTPNARALDIALEALEQKPCDNKLAIERYQDLVDFFGDKDIVKEILEDREEFKKWLDRIIYHVHKVDELARELEKWKESYEVEAERNAKLQQQLDKASAPEYEYIEVRSYHPSSRSSDIRLNEYFAAGYEFVRASEYIPPQNDKVGYVEYILRRKKGDSNE